MNDSSNILPFGRISTDLYRVELAVLTMFVCLFFSEGYARRKAGMLRPEDLFT